jgi:CheY-like chemotaxis protein
LANGEVALGINLNENVALVISDIEMPIMDESHSAKKFTNLETSHIPVILLTAKNSLFKSQIDIRSCADSYVTNPFLWNI